MITSPADNSATIPSRSIAMITREMAAVAHRSSHPCC